MSFLMNHVNVHDREAMPSNRRNLEVLLDCPAGAGTFPAVIQAPGLRYDMQRPAIASPANHLSANGVAVYRFNWTFYAGDALSGQPSHDLSLELRDMESVLQLARNDKRIDRQRLAVMGKSFGSLVAWRIFRADAELKSCILTTPLCQPGSDDAMEQVIENYPGIEQESRPVLILAGNCDPYCDLPTLYRFAALASGNVFLAVLNGNHGFELTGAEQTENGLADAEKFQRNIHLLNRHVENFLLA